MRTSALKAKDDGESWHGLWKTGGGSGHWEVTRSFCGSQAWGWVSTLSCEMCLPRSLFQHGPVTHPTRANDTVQVGQPHDFANLDSSPLLHPGTWCTYYLTGEDNSMSLFTLKSVSFSGIPQLTQPRGDSVFFFFPQNTNFHFSRRNTKPDPAQ